MAEAMATGHEGHSASMTAGIAMTSPETRIGQPAATVAV